MLPMSMWGLSVITGANSFITAFLAGGIFGYFSDLHDKDHALSELLESVADFLSNVAWFLAGELLVDSFTEAGGFHWQWLVIAILALLPLRMIPVYISMIGSGLDFASMVSAKFFICCCINPRTSVCIFNEFSVIIYFNLICCCDLASFLNTISLFDVFLLGTHDHAPTHPYNCNA